MRDRQQTQVEFVRVTNVKAPIAYVYDGGVVHSTARWPVETLRTQRDWGTHTNPKVWVMRELTNSRENALGIPLPAGATRCFQRSHVDWQLEFVGETSMEHTPGDGPLRIYTGDAPDLAGGRTCTAFDKISAHELEEAFEIRVRNMKDAAVAVSVSERMIRSTNWQVIEKSHEFTKVDASSIEFRVQMPSNGETVVAYRVRYAW